MNSKTKRANNQVNSVINVQEQREMVEKANHILSEMKSFTWRDLETQGKFSKNDKLSFISDDMLILGCDIGSETHYARAIDARGRELGRKALAFDNNAKGFQKARDWAVQLAAANDKKQIVLGLEPTGHYWFCLAAWMVSNGISVVQVNPYAVKQTNESCERWELRYAVSAGKGLCRTAQAVDVPGAADRGPEPEHEPAAQGDEDLFSRI